MQSGWQRLSQGLTLSIHREPLTQHTFLGGNKQAHWRVLPLHWALWQSPVCRLLFLLMLSGSNSLKAVQRLSRGLSGELCPSLHAGHPNSRFAEGRSFSIFRTQSYRLMWCHWRHHPIALEPAIIPPRNSRRKEGTKSVPCTADLLPQSLQFGCRAQARCAGIHTTGPHPLILISKHQRAQILQSSTHTTRTRFGESLLGVSQWDSCSC